MVKTLFVDGSGFDGKVSKAIVTDESGKVITRLDTSEERTNNSMEYEALYLACSKIADHGTIYTDSKLLVGQTTQMWKCNFEHLRNARDLCLALIKSKDLTIKWIPREINLAGKVFEREKERRNNGRITKSE